MDELLRLKTENARLKHALVRCNRAINYACKYYLDFASGAEVEAFINGYTGEDDLLPMLAQLEKQHEKDYGRRGGIIGGTK